MKTPGTSHRITESIEENRKIICNNKTILYVDLRPWELGLLIVLGVLLSLIYYLPILNSGNNLGIQDWDINFAWTEVTRVSLLNFHQFPFWNPYKCGGAVQFANPQISVISLQTIFALLFGTIRGIKFYIFIHGAIGFVGFYLLARQYKLSYLGSLLASIIFSFSGITGSFMSSGTIVFATFAYTPYILICLNKSVEKRRWGIISGAFFALSFYAGYHVSLLLGVYILVYVLVLSIVKRNFAPIKASLIMVLTSALLILPKLILSVQLLLLFPRMMNDVSGFSIQNFFYFLLSQKQNLFNEMDVQRFYYQIDENSLYVGMLPFALFLLFYIKNRKVVKFNAFLLITMIIILWIMLGNGIYPSLYGAIKHLPVFSFFRVAQRFRFDFIIPFALFIGLGLDNVLRLLQAFKLARPLAIICLAVIYIDLSIFSTTNFLSKTLIIKNPESRLSQGGAFIQSVGNNPDSGIERTISIPDKFLDKNTFIPWSFEYLNIKQNKGILNCYDERASRVNAIGIDDKNYRGEFYLLTPAQGVNVQNTFWSPNKLVYKITNMQKAINNTLIVDQNYYPGWIVKTDNQPCKRAIHSNGLLATRLDSLSASITFEFNPFLRWFRCRG